MAVSSLKQHCSYKAYLKKADGLRMLCFSKLLLREHDVRNVRM